jgi:integrase
MASKVMVSLKSILRANGVAHLGDHVRVEISRRSKEKLEAGRDIPTPAEVTRLLKVATGRWRALLMVAALTGLRASELRGLRWEDVDLKSGEVHVRQRADAWNTIGPPESDGSPPHGANRPRTGLRIAEVETRLPDQQARSGPTSVGTVENHKNTYLGVEKVMFRAGVVDRDGNPKFGLHSFRHFFASWCINPKSAGGRELPVKVVQTLLGHSSIVMTLDIYGHLIPHRH